MRQIATDTSRRSSREAWLVVGVILVVFAGSLLLITQRLRKELRVKIIQQDGIALGAALMVSPSVTEDLPEDLANDPEILFAKTAEKVLEAAKRREVMGVRLFTESGALQLSIGGSKDDLTPEQLAQLQQDKPINWFEPRARLSNHNSDVEASLIHTIVPLEQAGQFIGAVEFITNGKEVMMALRKLDRDLWVYAGLIFLIVGGITTGATFGNFGAWRARTSPGKKDGLEDPGSLYGCGT